MILIKFYITIFYEDIEWFAYKLSNNTMRHVSYELLPQRIGYAFCVTIQCDRLLYDIKAEYYSKSFSNDTMGKWTKLSSNFKDKLISNTMEDLDIWGNQL